MTGLLLAFSLLTVVLFFAFSKFSLVFLHNGKTRIYLKYACFFLLLYPKSKKSKAKPKQENAEIRKDIALAPFKKQFKSEEVRRKLPSFIVTVQSLTVYVGAKDPDQTVYLTTAVGQLIATLLCMLDEFFARVTVNACQIIPSFTRESIQLRTKVEVSFRFYQFIRLLLYALRKHAFRRKEALI